MKIFGFDYDGTIINIEPKKANAFGELVSKEWGVDKKEATDFWINKGGTSRRYKFDYFYEKQNGEKLKYEIYKEIEPKLSKLLKEKYYPKVKLLPHAIEILKFVRSNFDFVFVSSGVPLEEIRYLVQLNGLSDYFDLVLGTDEKYLTKKDHFKEILQTKRPSLFIFMGDAAEDIRVANKFGAVSIGLPTNQPKEVLKKAGAKFVCSLEESVSTIKKLL